jgi:integrase
LCASPKRNRIGATTSTGRHRVNGPPPAQEVKAPMRPKSPTGIRVRHARSCPAAASSDARCHCRPSYEAFVFSVRDGRKIRRTFPTLAAAKGWRADATSALRRGTLTTPSRVTVEEAAREWLEQARAGEILKPDGSRYKPAVLRAYQADLDRHVLPLLGGLRLSSLHRRDVQRLVDRLVGSGLSGSRVRGIVLPLRVVCRRALRNDALSVNPTANLELPAAAGMRERVASAEEAAALLAALPDDDRALWGTAVYAGLRRGELRGLRWEDIDDAVSVIHVRHGWDEQEGEIEPKSRKGTRRVPVVAPLRLLLLEHKARTGRRDSDLVFGRTASEPFTPTWVRKRALRAWRAAGLEPIGLHECRHSFVSLMHDAGLSLERIGDYVGHCSAYMTDRYRHLLDGHEQEAADVLDAYLAKRTGAQTGAQPALAAVKPLG